MESIEEKAVISWLFLTLLNTVDLVLYTEALRYPELNEMWVMGFLSVGEVTIAKLFMPVVVAHILLALPDLKKTTKILRYLCALYVFVFLWNILQFFLLV